jgi:hypothetical protein
MLLREQRVVERGLPRQDLVDPGFDLARGLQHRPPEDDEMDSTLVEVREERSPSSGADGPEGGGRRR